jgi:hypothetical protein
MGEAYSRNGKIFSWLQSEEVKSPLAKTSLASINIAILAQNTKHFNGRKTNLKNSPSNFPPSEHWG